MTKKQKQQDLVYHNKILKTLLNQLIRLFSEELLDKLILAESKNESEKGEKEYINKLIEELIKIEGGEKDD